MEMLLVLLAAVVAVFWVVALLRDVIYRRAAASRCSRTLVLDVSAATHKAMQDLLRTTKIKNAGENAGELLSRSLALYFFVHAQLHQGRWFMLCDEDGVDNAKVIDFRELVSNPEDVLD